MSDNGLTTPEVYGPAPTLVGCCAACIIGTVTPTYNTPTQA